MVFEGQGGAVGFGKGVTTVTLSEAAGGTELTYSAQAQIGGKLAQVGSRLIDSVAKKMSDDFFKAFRMQLAPPIPGDALTASASKATASEGNDKPTQAVGAGTDAEATKPENVVLQAATPNPVKVAAPHVVTPSAASAENGPFLVPGWWLGVAMLLGVFASFAGAHWMH
jgi:hypothetical protein